MRNRLSERLRTLEHDCAVIDAEPELFSFGDGRYTIRVANDMESRRRAYRMVYSLYLEKEYAKPHPSKMWLSIFDALPETTTLLVERNDGVAVGALTVVFDSPLGLPADNLYKPELDALRASGRRLSEIISLGVAEEAAAGSQILVKLFNFVYLLSRRVRGATDFIITVNPRHEKFYEKTLLFKPAGLEREYEKVGGAPALLLRLDLAVPEERVRLEHGPAETRPAKSRTLYPMFHAPTGEPEIVAGLAASLRPMTRREFGCFFKIETDLLAEATAKQRTHILSRYLDVSGDAQYLSSTQQREMTRDLRRPRSPAYSYAEATSRNLGLVTEREQEMLRNSTVAIAGVGAVGGHYLLTLTRMGVGGFIIADPDRFEPANLQRQAGAFASTLGRSKVEVMAEMARAINPEVRIRTFGEGLTEANAGEFLRGADLVLDGIDFFQIDARRLLFRAARRAGVYAVTSGPIGYGATLQVFDPAGMSFDEYFGIGPGMTRAQRIAAFAVGLMPGLPTGGRMDPSRVDFENEKGPALASSIMLCAGVMCTEALRILLGHGEPQCVPHASYFDPYARRHIRQCASNGRNGWRDRLIRRLALLSFPSLRRLHRTERMTAGRASERQGDSTMVRKIRRALKMAKKLMSPAPWTTLFFGPGMIH